MWKRIYEPSPGFQEAYSTTKMCDEALTPLLKYLQDKKICCPCDSDESAIVKWLKENTNSEIINFCNRDITKKTAQNIMKKCDIVITDPPFNEDGEIFIQFLKESDLDYIVFGKLDWEKEFGLDVYYLRKFIWEHRLYDGRPYNVVGHWYKCIKEEKKDE